MIINKLVVRTFTVLFIMALTFSALDLTPVHAAGIRYATPGGTGDCSSWASACTLQTALTGATSGDEVWAAAGTYKPSANMDRNATFQLNSNVAIYGGFAGTETARDQRNPTTRVTILSGDVDNNDSQTPILTDLTTVTGNTTNSYHVVTGTPSAVGATLDGFTITAGYANHTADIYYGGNGGGMIANTSSPTLTNITFSGNWANIGGGMSTDYSSSPTLTNVIFNNNYADAVGGGIFNDDSSSPALNNVAFNGNSAYYNGGGMANYRGSSPALKNVTFSSNSSGKGGGMYNYGNSNPTLTNVTFSGNSAVQGGGMFNDILSNPMVTNATFSRNSASFGGGMNNTDSDPQIRNTIFWENTAIGSPDTWQISNTRSYPSVSDSVVQDGCPPGSTCTHILTSDPQLGALGDYGGFTQTIPILPGSSAINTGDDGTCAATDQRGVTRPQGAHCDIGAYEWTTPPIVNAITRLNSNPTHLASVDFAVTFSEAVTGVNMSDFGLTTAGVSGAAVSGVNGSGRTYTVTVNTGSGTGTIRLDIVDDDSIVNLALDPLGGAGTGNGSYTSGETYDVRLNRVYLPLSIK